MLRLTLATVAALLVPSGAWAAPSDLGKVAVIDVTGDPAGIALAAEIAAEIARADAPRVSAVVQTGLVSAFAEEESAQLDAARKSLADAKDAVAHFDRSAALGHIAAGQTRLLALLPSDETRLLLADLMMVEGLANASDGDQAGAVVSFSAARRLDPARKLDPSRYLPDVVRAFAAAAAPPAGQGSIAINLDTGSAEAWLDGNAVGIAPVVVPADPGIHFVVVGGQDRRTNGSRVTVVKDRSTPVALSSREVPLAVKLERLRRRLRVAPDDAARAASLTRLASLIDANATLIVARSDGELTVRTWRDKAPGLGPARLVGTLSPRQVAQPFLPATTGLPADRRAPGGATPGPWWRSGWVKAGLVGGAIAAVVSAVVIGMRDNTTVQLDPDVGWR